jgi:hypothetical protein
MATLRGWLYAALWDGTRVILERFHLGAEARPATGSRITLPGGRQFGIHLDRHVAVTGTYSSLTGLTTWTVPYPHQNAAVAVFGPAWGLTAGSPVSTTYVSTATLTALGNWSAHPVIIGLPYNMELTLSEIFQRDQEGRTVPLGRLTVDRLVIRVRDTGYLKVTATPPARDPNVTEFNGRILGSADNMVGVPSVVERADVIAPVMAGGDAVITLSSSSHLPTKVVMIHAECRYHDTNQ